MAESEALGWAARGTEGLLEVVSLKKATESVRYLTVTAYNSKRWPAYNSYAVKYMIK